MARGDDLHAIKYLPLKLKGPAWHWLNNLPENSIGSWEDLEDVESYYESALYQLEGGE